MKLFSSQPRLGIWTPILFGLGGLALGIGATIFLAPRSGEQVRGQVRDLVRGLFKRDGHEEGLDDQLDRMAGEGGVGNEVEAPRVSG